MTNSDCSQKSYTIRTANHTLPLVKMIVQDVVEVSKEISETRERLGCLASGRNRETANDDYAKELEAIELAMDSNSERVDRWVNELENLGLSTTWADQGYVDFPTTREEEPVCLCWHASDQEVMYWHRLDEDCSARQLVDLPLIRQSVARHAPRSF
ncbi:MAG: hypothetical protein ACI814_000765 [Mariniblastus sp.]|jgi:hypothetical protein